MAQAQVHIVESFAVPPEVLFDRLVDHEGMSDWLGVRVSILAGPLDGGVGTIRRVHARGLVLDEEVTYLDRPRRMTYRIIRGLPLLAFHRGELLVEPWGKTGSQLTYDILMDSPVPGVARVMAGALAPQLRAGLSRLRGQLSERAA